MLLADLVIGADDRALEQAPNVLDGIGMGDAAHPLLLLMVDLLVLRVVIANAIIGRPLICADRLGFVVGEFPDEGMQGLAVGSRNLAHANVTAALDNARDDGFIGEVRPFPSAASDVLATDIGFVHFDRPTQLLGIGLGHGRTDAVAQIPRGFVRYADHALHLIRGNPLLRLDNQVDRHKPFLQGQVTIVENGARRDRELVAA